MNHVVISHSSHFLNTFKDVFKEGDDNRDVVLIRTLNGLVLGVNGA